VPLATVAILLLFSRTGTDYIEKLFIAQKNELKER
jgi:hypothetical protein